MPIYAVSGLLMLASGAFMALQDGLGPDFLAEQPLAAAAAVYLLGTVGWTVAALRQTRRLWLHLALVWAPLVAPAWPLARAVAISEYDDTAGLAVLLHMGPAGVVGLVCAFGALGVLLRMSWGSRREA